MVRLVLPLLLLTSAFASSSAPAADPGGDDPALARTILADPDLPVVLDMANALLKTGLNAGEGYGEVWIRDLNTFIEIAAKANSGANLRDAFLVFFKFQLPNGDIPDGFIAKERAQVGYKYRASALAPAYLAHKNTVETDQESSLVQAVERYIEATGDRSLLGETVDGKSVLGRLGMALNYVRTERFDRDLGLVWGATTVDWGDVQPETPWGVELDDQSHRACDIYDNALYLAAIDDYLHLMSQAGASDGAGQWRMFRAQLAKSVRAKLWDSSRRKFKPHVYLAGSPFPADFDEQAITFHGGTAVAMEAGLLSREEVAASLLLIEENVRKAGASSIGLTVFPPYPKGFFKNPSMGPYSYQNGGDWCWFGGRLIRQLIRNGLVREAYTNLKPMVARVRRHGDFYEWWSLENKPQGSNHYRGSAGVLGKAIEDLRTWATEHQGGVPAEGAAKPR
jgi:hypothetical protein